MECVILEALFSFVSLWQLHIAAANGYDKVAKYLLDSNVEVNTKDHDGWQPIHAAACWAHVSTRFDIHCLDTGLKVTFLSTWLFVVLLLHVMH